MRNDHYQKTGDTFFAFMTGLLLGTVAALMTQREHREKVQRTIEDVSQKGRDLTRDTAQKAQQVAENISTSVEDMSKKAQEETQSVARARNRDRQ